MIYSISAYIHHVIVNRLSGCKTLIDMGGKGKMKNRGFEVRNADIRYGIDATNLPFEDASFDAAVSIAVLEHIGDEEKQLEFIKESIRVARKTVLHWFPVHEEAEIFLAEIGHNHPTTMPTKKVLSYLEEVFTIVDITTVYEHLTNLSMLYPKLGCAKLYDYAYDHKYERYAILLELKKGGQL